VLKTFETDADKRQTSVILLSNVSYLFFLFDSVPLNVSICTCFSNLWRYDINSYIFDKASFKLPLLSASICPRNFTLFFLRNHFSENPTQVAWLTCREFHARGSFMEECEIAKESYPVETKHRKKKPWIFNDLIYIY